MGIEVLPENVSNQIAAGEVIERPVNVVKELIENSLDGQATRIEVQFRSGGSSFIRVNDNGVGMNTKEASLCFKRHATSKLKRFEDLQNLFNHKVDKIYSSGLVRNADTNTPEYKTGYFWLSDFVPHDDSYYQKVFSTIKRYCEGQKEF